MFRATIKSLLARKLRLALSAMAIVLGVMFVSSAFVLTDSLGGRFERLFQTVNADVAVQVLPTDDARADGTPPLLTEADLARLDQVDGVATVRGDTSSEGVTPFRKRDGKPLTSQGAPQLGFGATSDDFVGDSLLRIVDGRAPTADTEVAVTKFTSDQAGVGVGDPLKVYIGARYAASQYTVVGVLEYAGGRPSLSGETNVAFTQPQAQRLFYGRTGVFGGAQLTADAGVSQVSLKNRVAGAMPAEFEALTGAEIADRQASQLRSVLTFLNWFMLGFALVSLLVGMFLIFNTFNIIIAQRARELALLRALGAGWGQVTGSVLIEAVVVGLVASTIGLVAGIGVAAGLQSLAAASGFPLPEGGLTVSPLAISASYLVGVLMTVIAALIPAIRASAVPPIAAMREVIRPDKPMRVLTIVASVFTALGVALIAVALLDVGFIAILLGAGVFFTIIGVALLSPALTRPVAGTIGRAVSWGTASGLGRRNTLRNPRRTAVTAAALMIGVTLVSAVAVIGSSLRATVTDLVDNQLGAEVMILTNSQQLPTGREGFDPKRLDEVRALPGVTGALPYHFVILRVDGEANQPVTATDLGQAAQVFGLKSRSGTLTPTGADQAIVDENMAESRGWTVGDRVTVDTPVGGARPYQIAGIYDSQFVSGLVLPESAVPFFAGPMAYQGYVSVTDDADVQAVVSGVERIMSDYPMVTVGDRSSLIAQQNQVVDIVLTIFYVLLALAVIVAFLGIINTLVLSIYERTRELGLLRAVGSSRRQIRSMVRVESLLIAVYGCLLGIVLGVGVGMAVSAVLLGQDVLTTIAVPYGQLAGLLLAAAVAGVGAAVLPARRAARLNVLNAIAYE